MKKRNKTQRFSGKILKRLLKREDYAEFTGDLDEVYESMKNEGSGTKADIWYLWRIIESIPAIITENFYWSIAMIRNYIKIALRNIKNHKIFSFINIFGLSIGMSCCLITLVIVDNMVSDKTQENAENLYRVIRESQVGGQSLRGTGTPFMLDEALKNDYSEILNTVQLISTGKTLISYEGNKFNEHGVYYTDDEIFEVFTLHFAAGNPKTALSDPMSIIINEEIALKYFGDTDPIGKTLNVDNESDLVVTAVINNMPEGSNFDFRVIIPLSYYSSRNNVTSWDDYYSETYVLLDKNSSHEKMNPLLTDWAKKYTDKEDVYSLQPFNEIRLYGLDGSGEIYIVYIFTALSILVLLIGCINFMNLSTARSGSRALEIGLRKVVGAKKKDVIIQSLGESIIFAFLSLAVSFVLVYLSLPYINSMGDVSLNLSITPDLTMIGGCILITLITGVLSGCYPAFYISAFQPVRIIQGISRTNPRAAKLRQILVVAQFTFTLTFIIVTIVLHQQLSYMKTADMGFQRDNIVILDMDDSLRAKYESIRSEILTSPDVTTVTAADCYPYGPIGGYRGVDWEGKNPEDEFIFFGYRISPDFIDAFELNIIEGQDFSNVQPEDYTKIILNEAAVEKLGFENPIGKRLTILETNGEIIGVIKNFNYRTIDNLIEPLFLRYGPNKDLDHLVVKYNAGSSEASVLSHLDNIWNKYAPELHFEYEFLDDRIDRINGEADAWLIISKFISFQAIFISCMGLFALASFAAEQKTKEIGIRKVLGSTVTGIVSLLSKEFMKWVVLSIILAWPAAWFVSGKFLELLPYHEDLNPMIFIIPSFLVVTLGFLTIGLHILRAAHADPVNSIRHE